MGKIRRTTGVFHSGIVVFIAIAIFTTSPSKVKSESQPFSEARINKALFEKNRNVRLPVGYRRCEHVGTRIKVDGFSVLDGSKITIPQVMDAYVEPSAYQAFKKTGKWPEGTQIVKDFSLVKTGTDCNTTTFVCSTMFGRGVFEERYAGLGMMIKDSRLFPLSAGHWGYFSFLPAGARYQLLADARPREQCSSCHEKGAAETDYVFSKSHIGLLPGNRQ